MALLAMAQYGCALASLNAQFTLAESKAEITCALAERRVKIELLSPAGEYVERPSSVVSPSKPIVLSYAPGAEV